MLVPFPVRSAEPDPCSAPIRPVPSRSCSGRYGGSAVAATPVPVAPAGPSACTRAAGLLGLLATLAVALLLAVLRALASDHPAHVQRRHLAAGVTLANNTPDHAGQGDVPIRRFPCRPSRPSPIDTAVAGSHGTREWTPTPAAGGGTVPTTKVKGEPGPPTETRLALTRSPVHRFPTNPSPSLSNF